MDLFKIHSWKFIVIISQLICCSLDKDENVFIKKMNQIQPNCEFDFPFDPVGNLYLDAYCYDTDTLKMITLKRHVDSINHLLRTKNVISKGLGKQYLNIYDANNNKFLYQIFIDLKGEVKIDNQTPYH